VQNVTGCFVSGACSIECDNRSYKWSDIRFSEPLVSFPKYNYENQTMRMRQC